MSSHSSVQSRIMLMLKLCVSCSESVSVRGVQWRTKQVIILDSFFDFCQFFSVHRSGWGCITKQTNQELAAKSSILKFGTTADWGADCCLNYWSIGCSVPYGVWISNDNTMNETRSCLRTALCCKMYPDPPNTRTFWWHMLTLALQAHWFRTWCWLQLHIGSVIMINQEWRPNLCKTYSLKAMIMTVYHAVTLRHCIAQSGRAVKKTNTETIFNLIEALSSQSSRHSTFRPSHQVCLSSRSQYNVSTISTSLRSGWNVRCNFSPVPVSQSALADCCKMIVAVSAFSFLSFKSDLSLGLVDRRFPAIEFRPSQLYGLSGHAISAIIGPTRDPSQASGFSHVSFGSQTYWRWTFSCLPSRSVIFSEPVQPSTRRP